MITKIKEYRKKAGMTQEDLGNLTGLTQGQIARIESGKTDIGINQLNLFAKVFNVSFSELLPDEIAPEPITPEERVILDMIRKSQKSDTQKDKSA